MLYLYNIEYSDRGELGYGAEAAQMAAADDLANPEGLDPPTC
jgi:hypothetical protein